MKKMFVISVAVVALTALVVISCEKEESALPATTSTSAKSSQKKPSVHACCYQNMTERGPVNGGICCEDGKPCCQFATN
jgi:hypothetical protein